RPVFEQPGFAKTVIQPVFIEGMEWAKGSENTIEGKIEVAWRRKEGRVEINVTIPDGMSAEVRLPGDRVEMLYGGAHEFTVR
ncbi:MAG: alpha-L-rhamnosidase C-terminal domain-containing protein, partial [Spirochaetota bacterium]